MYKQNRILSSNLLETKCFPTLVLVFSPVLKRPIPSEVCSEPSMSPAAAAPAPYFLIHFLFTVESFFPSYHFRVSHSRSCPPPLDFCKYWAEQETPEPICRCTSVTSQGLFVCSASTSCSLWRASLVLFATPTSTSTLTLLFTGIVEVCWALAYH